MIFGRERFHGTKTFYQSGDGFRTKPRKIMALLAIDALATSILQTICLSESSLINESARSIVGNIEPNIEPDIVPRVAAESTGLLSIDCACSICMQIELATSSN